MVRDKVRVRVMDRVDVRVSVGIRLSALYFLSQWQPHKPAPPHFTYNLV